MSRRSPRVVVRIAGGLGNQLFMYAAGSRLATVHDVPLLLDVRSGFRGDPYRRTFTLAELPIRAEVAGAWTSYDEPLTGRPRELAQLARRRAHLGPRSWVVDDAYRCEPALLDLPVDRDRYLRGYFQSERYFADVADEVRADLHPTGPLSDESQATAALIEAAGDRAVSVHARLLYELPQIDDRAALPDVAEVDPPKLGTYYDRAAAAVASEVGDPHFFLFGDHPEAMASQLDLPGRTTVVAHNSHAKATEDLALMARCAHHIICASTFGWWGAWLAEHPGQHVIAPDRGYPNRDMIPARWRRLPVD